MGSEIPKFLRMILKAFGGNPENSQLARFGASRDVGGVKITAVPTEAAHVIDELVKPNAVIVSNETATNGGKVIASTKTDRFIKATKVPVHAPLSEATMAFNGAGNRLRVAD